MVLKIINNTNKFAIDGIDKKKDFQLKLEELELFIENLKIFYLLFDDKTKGTNELVRLGKITFEIFP